MRLRQLRAATGLTQQQVADQIDIDRALYVRYENGTRTPPLAKLIKLADFFGVTLDELVGREPPSPREPPVPCAPERVEGKRESPRLTKYIRQVIDARLVELGLVDEQNLRR